MRKPIYTEQDHHRLQAQLKTLNKIFTVFERERHTNIGKPLEDKAIGAGMGLLTGNLAPTIPLLKAALKNEGEWILAHGAASNFVKMLTGKAPEKPLEEAIALAYGYSPEKAKQVFEAALAESDGHLPRRHEVELVNSLISHDNRCLGFRLQAPCWRPVAVHPRTRTEPSGSLDDAPKSVKWLFCHGATEVRRVSDG